jgi:DDB1- and CUL4-associated factor 11
MGHWADTSQVSRVQFLRLLQHAGVPGLHRIFASRRRAQLPDDDEGSEPDNGYGEVGPKRRRGRGRASFQKVPSDEGRALMEGGLFGTTYRPEDRLRRKKRLAYQIMRRELGLGSAGRLRNENRLMAQGLVPSTKADTIIHYDARCYSGQFSRSVYPVITFFCLY